MSPYLTLLRPQQWLKNLMLFFPPFLSGTLLLPGVWGRGVVPFIAFALVSSSGYILNDLLDRNQDRLHAHKSARPLAANLVSVPFACLLACLLISAGGVLAGFCSLQFTLWLGCYALVTAAYSLWLKHIPVVDLFCIATGFVFRLLAGGVVFGIDISNWLFLSVLLLSLFLAAGKRLAEKQHHVDGTPVHRKVLISYPDGFLDGVLFMTGSAVLVTYTMYVLTHQRLIYTVPLCCFGLLRYILRVKAGQGGDPTESLLRDPWLFGVGAAWAVLVGWGLYGR